MIKLQRKTLCVILQSSKDLSGMIFTYFLSVLSTAVILETKAYGVTYTSFSYLYVTLPHDDLKWEIILKCGEPGGGEDHTNMPCWRALGQQDLWLKGFR